MKTKRSKLAVALLAGILSTALMAPTKTVQADATPYLGQIEFYAFNFAPRGWALCDGQILPINSNQSLYSLLGTTFGGDGRTSFALPDMRSRIPVHDGGSAGPGLTHRPLGQKGGQEQVTLTTAEIPTHTHMLRGSTASANQVIPGGHVVAAAATASEETYRAEAPNTTMHSGSVSSTPSGGHENRAPYLVISCAIALQGVFPSRN